MDQNKVVIIGAGPAGLTAAYWLASRHGITSHILEGSEVVGGISQTVVREGYRFDLGGHRFFSKVETVNHLWKEILPEDEFLQRPRLSRIFYNGKFFDYPLKPINALTNLGLWEAIRCIGSYVWVRINRPDKELQKTFEGWVAARFGWRLYRTFFKTYTEKVWGVPATAIQADWAAQRIKNLNLFRAVLNSFSIKTTRITSLIEQFDYPKFGPGQMWETAANKSLELGCTLQFGTFVTEIELLENGNIAVRLQNGELLETNHLVSTMPINKLIEGLNTKLKNINVEEAAAKLKHRDFLTVALVVPKEFSFPDNWIYVHSPEVKLGRIQNFLSWSPEMVPNETETCLGLEYFVNDGDSMWNMDDMDLIKFAAEELEKIGLVAKGAVKKGWVVRVEKAYPVYDSDYAPALDEIRKWLDSIPHNIYPVGRNGMHRYNNQDHSMMTAIFAAENIATGANNDLWAVNVDEEYHETTNAPSGTGRMAPIFSKKEN